MLAITAALRPAPPAEPSRQSSARALLAPQAERFEPVSPQYPLLKRTLGFFGAKQFELEIKPGERPHVVFLFLESFRAADVGVLGGKHAASPEFDRLSREGVLFRNFYGCSVQTTRAVVGSLFGILPCFSEKSPQGANMKTPLIGLADLFNGRNYTSAYFSGAPRRFERQGEFFANHGYAEVHCDDGLGRFAPQASRTSWGYHDEYLLDYALTWLIEKDRQRQAASNHDKECQT